MKGRLKIGIVLLLVVMMTIPAFGMPIDAGGSDDVGSEYASDRIIVKFAENATAAEKMAIKARNNLETKRKFKMGAEVMTVNDNMPVEQVVEALNRNGKVEYAELDYILEAAEIQIESIPSDAMLGDLWGIYNIDALEAWEIEQGREDVIVAVIDTGVQIDHPDLDGNIWINTGETGTDIYGNDKATNGLDDDGNGYEDDVNGWDFCNGDNSVYDGIFDDHGTHVSGTIAAEADGAGVVGVAPYVKIIPLKFIDSDGYGYSSDAANAIEYAGANGAKIINASWGGGSYNTTLKTVIDEFGSKYGGVFVAAAGNGEKDEELGYNVGFDTDDKPHYPSSYNCTNIISVAAIDSSNTITYFSNYGTDTVDLFAPGSYIKSTLPYDDHAYYSGTSMATPHVSGVLALMISHEMNENGLDIDSELLRSPELLINDVMESTIYDVSYEEYVKSSGRLNANLALSLTPVIETNTFPECTEDPTIGPLTEGKVQAGTELTADYGTWAEYDEGQTLSYDCQWQISTTNSEDGIYYSSSVNVDALDSTYNGDYIRIEVTATDDGYPSKSTIATSTWYEIENTAPVNTSIPELTPYEPDGDIKTVEAGTELTASTGDWEDNRNQIITYEYEWEKLVGETIIAIDGETDELYTPYASDVGSQIRVKVTASDDKDPAGSDFEYSTWYQIVEEPVVNDPPENISLPTITGGVVFGSSLANVEFEPGTWNDEYVDTLEFEIVDWQTSPNQRSIYYMTEDYVLGDKDKYVRIGVSAYDGDLTSEIVYSEWYKTVEEVSEPIPDPDPTTEPDPALGLEVVSTTPEDGARNIDLAPTITIEFNKAIDLTDMEAITLPGGTVAVDEPDENSNILIIHASSLDLKTTYVLTIGSGAVTGTDGGLMTEDFILKFKTVFR